MWVPGCDALHRSSRCLNDRTRSGRSRRACCRFTLNHHWTLRAGDPSWRRARRQNRAHVGAHIGPWLSAKVLGRAALHPSTASGAARIVGCLEEALIRPTARLPRSVVEAPIGRVVPRLTRSDFRFAYRGISILATHEVDAGGRGLVPHAQVLLAEEHARTSRDMR
jgi:hypothetical protein